jgi:hypothetical protein
MHFILCSIMVNDMDNKPDSTVIVKWLDGSELTYQCSKVMFGSTYVYFDVDKTSIVIPLRTVRYVHQIDMK